MTRIGIFHPFLNTRGGGEKVVAVMAEVLSRHHEVHFVVPESAGPVNLDEIGRYLRADLSRVRLSILRGAGAILRHLPCPETLRQVVSFRRYCRQIRQHNFDIFINSAFRSSLPPMAPRSVYVCWFPHPLVYYSSSPTSRLGSLGQRVREFAARHLVGDRRRAIDDYTVIAGTSQYARDWIRQMWKRDAFVFYPICDEMAGDVLRPKEKIILHVGRFFADQPELHHKCQGVLLDAFCRMTETHAAGWQLHFVGGTADDAASLRFALELVERAGGFPVFFHFNAPFSRLSDLYRRASIYWHATGFGSDPERHPVKQEHFGISTVEAMSAGTVPVVINSAGQKETVIHNENGFLWDTLEEMRDCTEQVIHDAQLRGRLAAAAQQAAKAFGREAFERRVWELMERVGVGREGSANGCDVRPPSAPSPRPIRHAVDSA